MLGVAALALLLFAAPTGGAELPEDPEVASPTSRAVDLGDLLKLPDSLRFEVETRGGATRGEWRQRFRELREDLAEERESLEGSKRELEKLAGNADAWKLAPPGAGSVTDSPLDYRLRTEIRQHQAEIERLEGRLRSLEIEANLAGVPEAWSD